MLFLASPKHAGPLLPALVPTLKPASPELWMSVHSNSIQEKSWKGTPFLPWVVATNNRGAWWGSGGLHRCPPVSLPPLLHSRPLLPLLPPHPLPPHLPLAGHTHRIPPLWGMGNKNTTETEVTGGPCLPRVQRLAHTDVVITR